MRLLLTLLLTLALVGCTSAQGTPAKPPPPLPTIPAVAEGLSSQSEGRFEAIGYLYRTPAGACLVGGLSFSQGEVPTPLSATDAIWLPDPPSLPADAVLDSAGGVSYLIVRTRGQLSPKGSYGPGGGYAHQLTQATLAPLSVRDLSMKLLLDNSAIYDNQPVRLSGQIMLGVSTALLVDQLGVGGVPSSDAQQIKLVGMIEGDALRVRLTATSGGIAHFGPVQVVGIWRRSALYLLAIIPD
ncbi:MAG: hypothetical protein WCJ55_00315 [Chloroflexales bacterium]